MEIRLYAQRLEIAKVVEAIAKIVIHCGARMHGAEQRANLCRGTVVNVSCEQVLFPVA
ncbi:hypothetical protein D3C87_1796480 [compost metagenome]